MNVNNSIPNNPFSSPEASKPLMNTQQYDPNTQGCILYDKDTEDVTKGRKPVARTLPHHPYIAIGSGESTKRIFIDGIEEYPIGLLNALIELSKPAQQVLTSMINKMKYDYQTKTTETIIFSPSFLLTKSQKRHFKIVYKELFQANLLRRVKNNYYMVNPNAVPTKQYVEVIRKWRKLKGFNVFIKLAKGVPIRGVRPISFVRTYKPMFA